VDHRELLLLSLGCHNLESDSLQVVAEEIHALVRPVPEVLTSATLDNLESALLDDVEGPLLGDAVLGRRAGKADAGFVWPNILSDRIALLQLDS